MRSFSNCFVTLALLTAGHFSSADPASSVTPRDVILHLSFVDGISFTYHGQGEMDRMLAERNPGARIISLSASSKRLGYLTKWGAERARRRLLEQIKQLKLNDGESIRMLVVSTHGATRDSSSVLQHIGKITPTGLDEQAKEFFQPLQGKVHPAARLVLESCSTMCGTEKEAAERSRHLLQYLGADYGSLFGAVTPISNGPSVGRSWKWAFLMGMLTLGGVEVMTVAEAIMHAQAGLPPPWAGTDVTSIKIDFGLHVLKNTALWASMITGTVFGLVPLKISYDEFKGRTNRGLIIQSTPDGAVETTSVKYSIDRDKILGAVPACEAILVPAASEH